MHLIFGRVINIVSIFYRTKNQVHIKVVCRRRYMYVHFIFWQFRSDQEKATTSTFLYSKIPLFRKFIVIFGEVLVCFRTKGLKFDKKPLKTLYFSYFKNYPYILYKRFLGKYKHHFLTKIVGSGAYRPPYI